jgi:secreted trypsin-like serine protease
LDNKNFKITKKIFYNFFRICDRYNSCSFCGGTLIDLTTVVTAAHCIEDPTEYTTLVYLGLQDRTLAISGNWPVYTVHMIIVVS